MARRRASWVEAEGRVGREGPRRLPPRRLPGLLGMALAGLTERPARHLAGEPRAASRPSRSTIAGRIPAEEIDAHPEECHARGVSCHDALMDRVRLAGDSLRRPVARLPPGRAADGRQGAGAARLSPTTCSSSIPISASAAARKLCIEMCSGQAITPGETACRPSTARSASTAAPACGTAAYVGRRPGAKQYRFPRRGRRIAFHGELGPSQLAPERPITTEAPNHHRIHPIRAATVRERSHTRPSKSQSLIPHPCAPGNRAITAIALYLATVTGTSTFTVLGGRQSLLLHD